MSEQIDVQVLTTGMPVAGRDGHSPFIHAELGTWFVWDDEKREWRNTGVTAHGRDGADGEPGPRGERGEPGQRGEKGEPGESIVGPKGEDGFSPVVSVAEGDGYHSLIIEDAQGTKVVRIQDGEKYDDTELKASVLAARTVAQTNRNNIGSLAELQTTAKGNLVEAINEAAQSGGGSYDDTELRERVGAVEGAVEDLNRDLSLKADKTELPTSLPNPNALTLTGAVSATYDGSEPLTVDIPQGGGSSARWEEYTITSEEGTSYLGFRWSEIGITQDNIQDVDYIRFWVQPLVYKETGKSGWQYARLVFYTYASATYLITQINLCASDVAGKGGMHNIIKFENGVLKYVITNGNSGTYGNAIVTPIEYDVSKLFNNPQSNGLYVFISASLPYAMAAGNKLKVGVAWKK